MMEKDGMTLVVELEKDKTPETCKRKSAEFDTPVPSTLNEICSLDLGSVVAKFVPASEFCKSNLQYIKKMKEMELIVLDYAMCKETMDPMFFLVYVF